MGEHEQVSGLVGKRRGKGHGLDPPIHLRVKEYCEIRSGIRAASRPPVPGSKSRTVHEGRAPQHHCAELLFQSDAGYLLLPERGDKRDRTGNLFGPHSIGDLKLIRSERMMIRVEQAKGRRDRATRCSPNACSKTIVSTLFANATKGETFARWRRSSGHDRRRRQIMRRVACVDTLFPHLRKSEIRATWQGLRRPSFSSAP